MKAYQENPRRFVRRMLLQQLCIISVAGTIGATVGIGSIALANIFYDMRHTLGPWVDTFGWALMIPTLIVKSFTKEIPNGYVVNGILGAITFASIAAFWEFVVKGFKALPDKNDENE
jgi:hypothetical protein